MSTANYISTGHLPCLAGSLFKCRLRKWGGKGPKKDRLTESLNNEKHPETARGEKKGKKCEISRTNTEINQGFAVNVFKPLSVASLNHFKEATFEMSVQLRRSDGPCNSLNELHF